MTAIAQQINLLIDELKPRRVLLVAWHGAALIAATAILLGVWSAASAFAAAGLEDSRDRLTKQVAHVVQVTASLHQSARLEADPQLVARVAGLQTEKARRLALIDVISKSVDQDTGGFSEYLQQLALDHDPMLWLTALIIGDGGKRLELEGLTLEARQVPQFLRRLTARERFVGHRFDGFEMAPDASGALAFRLTGPAKEGT
jgi:hypothetical protein